VSATAAERASTLLEVEKLSVRYGGPTGHLAVDSASLTVGRGERVALVGESGSGKTTLAMAIAGFQTADDVSLESDTFRFDGRGIGSKPAHGSPLPKRIPGIAMVFQDAMTSLDATWTIGSQLRAVLKSQGKASRKALDAKAAEWLRRVSLTDTERVLKTRPYELSGGMRQRVMLALALCSEPSLLIADEPTSALDAGLARSTMDLLVELTDERDTALLIVTHDIHLCREYTDRLLVMYHGRLVDQLRARAAERDATHAYTAGLLKCIPTLGSVNEHSLPTLADFLGDGKDVAA
jgi:peptide/nickel transport system ATP-binding protein